MMSFHSAYADPHASSYVHQCGRFRRGRIAKPVTRACASPDLTATLGKTVTVHYTLLLGGKQVDSTRDDGRDAIKFECGQGLMLGPIFAKVDQVVQGMTVGQKKSFGLSDGVSLDKSDREYTFGRSELEAKGVELGSLQVGAEMMWEETPCKVTAVGVESATFDFGDFMSVVQQLVINIEVMGVE